MFRPKKSLTLLSLLLILSFDISEGSDTSARGRPWDRRISERSVSEGRQDRISGRSYDARVVASLLGNSLLRALYLSHASPVATPPSSPLPPPPSRPDARRREAARNSGVNPEILSRIAPFDPHIQRHCATLGVDPNLARAIIYVESGGDPRAISRRGARGLMQLMPDTAFRLGVRNVYDPSQNIRGGVQYLRTLLDQFHNVELALWGYNAGPGAVERRSIPSETRRYIPAVLRVKAVLDRLDGRPVRARAARTTGQSP
jgi:soluble lytic murein transglycosylase-like protein